MQLNPMRLGGRGGWFRQSHEHLHQSQANRIPATMASAKFSSNSETHQTLAAIKSRSFFATTTCPSLLKWMMSPRSEDGTTSFCASMTS